MTEHRAPAGEYPSAAQVHLLDLELEADRLLAELPGHGRRTRTLAREGGVSLVLMAMEGGDMVKEHSADGSVTAHLLRGHATLTAAGEAIDVLEGQVVMFAPGVRHDVRAEAQSVLLLTVSGAHP